MEHSCRRLRESMTGPTVASGVLLILSGCGGGSSSNPYNNSPSPGGPGPAPTYSVGGAISGLTAAGLMLANGADTISPASGATNFTFATQLNSGAAYAVSVERQPSGETCQITAGSGSVNAANVTSVAVNCAANTYGVGGTINGLNGSGLVLANGSDTVSLASGATSFVFKTQLTSSTRYAVTVQSAPPGQLCHVTNGTGTVSGAVVNNIAVACSAAWTWMSGANTKDALGVYGTQGTPGTSTVPGARDSAATWTDASGHLWLFGGIGYDSAGNTGELNDLWMFTPSTGGAAGQWTWVSGSNTAGASGIYGTQGTAGMNTVPGGRNSAAIWTDASGHLWLFGGYGLDSAGHNNLLNDLWMFTPGSAGAAGQWTWMGGANTTNALGVYGTQGTAGTNTVPGARRNALSWMDASGHLWLFGGRGFASVGGSGELNDLWLFTPGAGGTSGEWTWMSGSSTVGASGVYGTQGTAGTNTVPGARDTAMSWTDASGHLWLFGGFGFDSTVNTGDLNDLWMFTPGMSGAAGQWTWVSGASTSRATGVYGTQGTAGTDTTPGARDSGATWTDSSGHLWLFGGFGYTSPLAGISYLNDLWMFTPGTAGSTGQWTWVGGAEGTGASGAYGTQGMAGTDTGPGARQSPMTWTDASGHLWLFGGYGYASTGSAGELNDLWVY